MAGRAMFVSSITRYGGGERWMCDAAAGLAQRGHRVLAVVRPGSELERRMHSIGIDFVPVEMRGDLDPAAILRVRSIARRFSPGAVCVNLDRELRISSLALLLAGRHGRKRTRLIPRRGSEFPLKNNFHYRFVYTRFVDRVIANSHATKRTMLSTAPWFDPARAAVIYNGIDPAVYDTLHPERERLRSEFRRELGLSGEALLAVLVGELTERKGHRFIMEAAGEVIRAYPETRFLFAGDGDARGDIERHVRDGGLREHVRLLGFRDDIPRLLTAADILLLPSSVEGFGYVLAEAMAARLPVVATRASSTPEVVEEGVTGLLHEPGDSDGIGSHLMRLLGDAVLRGNMGEAGYNRVRERFHIDRMIDDIERLFFA